MFDIMKKAYDSTHKRFQVEQPDYTSDLTTFHLRMDPRESVAWDEVSIVGTRLTGY